LPPKITKNLTQLSGQVNPLQCPTAADAAVARGHPPFCDGILQSQGIV
jgi:hypothetical protein